MAEGSVTLLAKPQKNNSDGRKSGIQSEEKTRNVSSNSSASRYRRASLGSYYDGNSSGRSSSGKPSCPNNSQDAVPHYLRASTGSCHDFCKYGRKQTIEVKPWQSLSKRITKPPSDQLIPGESSVLERKKVEVVKPASSGDTKAHQKQLNSSPHSKTLTSNSPEIIKHELALPSKKVEVSLEQELATGKRMTKTEKRSNYTSTKRSPLVEPESLVVKSSPSPGISEGKIGRGRTNNNLKNGKAVVASKASKKKVLRPSDASSSSRPSITETVNKSKKNRNLKLVYPQKDQKRGQKASVKPKNDKIPEKSLYVIKTESMDIFVESIQDGDVTASFQTPSNQSPKTLSHPHYSLSPHEGDQVEEEEGKEEGEGQEGEDGEGEEGSKIENNKNKPGKLIKNNYEAGNRNGKKVGAGIRSGTLKKGQAVVSRDKDSSPLQLKFRRGRVIELHSENNTPRKLRFRHGRVLVGNKDGNADVRRNFKKKGVVDDKDRTSPRTAKVVLRHQKVQDKKDTQVLLNNVIEETASKLVESRKSKVKALVGAFETVISLQESKPSSQAVN